MKPYKRGRTSLLRAILITLIFVLISIICARCCTAEEITSRDPVESFTCTSIQSSYAPSYYLTEESDPLCDNEEDDIPILYIDPQELVDYYLDNMMVACVNGDSEEGVYWQELREEVVLTYSLDSRIFTYDDLWWMSKIIYAEAGADFITDELQCMVGAVLYNRWLSPEFPDTLEECVFQKGQYAPTTSSDFKTATPNERSVSNAVRVLTGEFSIPETVVFQANFRQGSGTYKEIYVPELGKSSYFCYSSYPELYER